MRFMLDLLPHVEASSENSNSFWSLVLRRVIKNFKLVRDLSVGAVLSLATLLLQYHYGLITFQDWQAHRQQWILSILVPPLALSLLDCLWRLLKAPSEVYRLRVESDGQEIQLLRNFKKSVEDKEVRLVVVRCNRTMTPFGNRGTSGEFLHVETAECVSITFANLRAAGVPGKSADDVRAKVTYDDPSGRSIQQDGRWNELDQPAVRDPLRSQNDLLRITFMPGDEHHLDIAAKFAKGCFAINNDCFRDGLQRSERLLTGTTVRVTVRLVAQYVDQTFYFELKNPVNGQMAIVPS